MSAAGGSGLQARGHQSRIERLGASVCERELAEDMALRIEGRPQQGEPGQQSVGEDREHQEPAPGAQVLGLEQEQRVLQVDPAAGHLVQAGIARPLAEQPGPRRGNGLGQVVDRLGSDVQRRAPAEGQVREPFQGDGGEDDTQVERHPEDLSGHEHGQVGHRPVEDILGLEHPGAGQCPVPNLLAHMGESLPLNPTPQPGKHGSNDPAKQGDVLDRGVHRAGAPQCPGKYPSADYQELNAHQEEDIPGHVDRLVPVVAQEGGGGPDPQEKAEDGENDGDEPLGAPEGGAGQERAHVRCLGLPAGLEPAAQAPAPVQGRMGVRALHDRGDAVQIDLAVPVDECLAGRGAIPQLLLVLVEVILEVDQIRDRPAVLGSGLRRAFIGLGRGGGVGI